MPAEQLLLPITEMADRHTGLTPEIAGAYVQAAHLYFDRHHESPATFHIDDDNAATKAKVEWGKADERTRAAGQMKVIPQEMGRTHVLSHRRNLCAVCLRCDGLRQRQGLTLLSCAFRYTSR